MKLNPNCRILSFASIVFIIFALAACSSSDDKAPPADEDTDRPLTENPFFTPDGDEPESAPLPDGDEEEAETIEDTESAEGTETGEDTEGENHEAEDLEAEEEGGFDVEFAWLTIPGGVFEMGCSAGDLYCERNEEPRHEVNIAEFLMTAHEITHEQYEAVIGTNPSYFANCPTCPVEMVTWADAKAFCEAIGGYLPSEAQWEYAARATQATPYYCGEEAECLDTIAWYYENGLDMTHPVGEKEPNAFGLFDMLGNVYEWVMDCYHDTYRGAPDNALPWEEDGCEERVIRGGSYMRPARELRASARVGLSFSTNNENIGFRCAKAMTYEK